MPTEDVELRREIRQLAHMLVRFEAWACEARDAGQWDRVTQLVEQREITQQRRSSLLREAWAAERAIARRVERASR